jgi:hypothetical protein
MEVLISPGRVMAFKRWQFLSSASIWFGGYVNFATEATKLALALDLYGAKAVLRRGGRYGSSSTD